MTHRQVLIISFTAGLMLCATSLSTALALPLNKSSMLDKPTQAKSNPPLKDYLAVYQILPLRSDKPIGEYRVTQRWLPESHSYLQQVRIEFSWQVLLASHTYTYRDEVHYSTDNGLTYRIDENNDGKIRQISGAMPSLNKALTISTKTVAGTQHLVIDSSSFDYTLFALRFPKPCLPEMIGTQSTARMLVPASGKIGISQSHYVSITDLTLPNASSPTSDLCLIETQSEHKEMARRSWVNKDGYLVYDIAENYRLRLLPEASRLPSQRLPQFSPQLPSNVQGN